MPATPMRKKQLEELGSLPVMNNERFDLIQKDADGLKNAVRQQAEQQNTVLMTLSEVKSMTDKHEQHLADLTKQMESVFAFLQKAKTHMVP